MPEHACLQCHVFYGTLFLMACMQGWTDDMLQQPAVFVHQRARLRDEEVLTSLQYSRSSTRDSADVLIDFAVSGVQIGRVSQYLRIVAVAADGKERTLRVAPVDLYKRLEPYRDRDIGDPIHRATYSKDPAVMFTSMEYAVDVSTISTKVTQCKQRVAQKTVLLYLQYQFKSKFF